MNALRTLAFNLVFYSASVVIVLLVPIPVMLGAKAIRRHVHLWAWTHRWCARLLLGIRTQVEGVIPTFPALYVAKHQAMYETVELPLILHSPAIVMKRELMRIPFWGWAARRYGMLSVDRTASAGALRALMRDAKAARAEGRSVVLFPEGTRVSPGTMPPLQSGFAGLYKILNLPVVPIALDSGRLLPRKGPKRPGIVTMRIGGTIPSGLPREEIEARVHAAINALETAP